MRRGRAIAVLLGLAIVAPGCAHRRSAVSEALECPQDEVHQGKVQTQTGDKALVTFGAAAAVLAITVMLVGGDVSGAATTALSLPVGVERRTRAVFFGCGRTVVCDEGGPTGWQNCEVRAWAPASQRVETPDVERRDPWDAMKAQSRAKVRPPCEKVRVGFGDERNWNLRGCGHHWECRALGPRQFACRSTDTDEAWTEHWLEL